MPLNIKSSIGFPQAANAPEVVDGYIHRLYRHLSAHKKSQVPIALNCYILAVMILFFQVCLAVRGVMKTFNRLNQLILNTVTSAWLLLILTLSLVLTL